MTILLSHNSVGQELKLTRADILTTRGERELEIFKGFPHNSDASGLPMVSLSMWLVGLSHSMVVSQELDFCQGSWLPRETHDLVNTEATDLLHPSTGIDSASLLSHSSGQNNSQLTLQGRENTLPLSVWEVAKNCQIYWHKAVCNIAQLSF